jgi:hypothetical protein
MLKFISMTVASAAVLFLTVGNAHADKNVDKVVAEMSKGDVSQICKGGIPGITKASTKATMKLAKAGKIKGNFEKIGKTAGMTFGKKKCS